MFEVCRGKPHFLLIEKKRGQPIMTAAASPGDDEIKQKLLRGDLGDNRSPLPGAFLEKSPLAAGGKKIEFSDGLLGKKFRRKVS
jgi:hypothetical protein